MKLASLRNTLFLLLVFILNVCSINICAQVKNDSSKQVIIELNNRIEILQMKNEDLEDKQKEQLALIESLKNEFKVSIAKSDSLGSHIDMFGILVTGVFTLTAIFVALAGYFSWNNFNKRIEKFEEDIKREIEPINKETSKLPDDRKRIRQAVYDAHHALYNIHFKNKEHGLAAQVGAWCLERHIEYGVEAEIYHWLTTVNDRIDDSTGSSFLVQWKNDIYRIVTSYKGTQEDSKRIIFEITKKLNSI